MFYENRYNLIKNLEIIFIKLQQNANNYETVGKIRKKCSSMYLNNTLKFNFESKIPSIITDIIKIKVK